jgi:hypothetical protein
MSTPSLSVPAASTAATATICAVQSFASVLRNQLGEQAWSELAPDIQARFAMYISAEQRLLFVGKMQWVYCSPIGALLMRLLRRFSILPSICARDCDFEFDIGMHAGDIVKQRRYALAAGQQFSFRSHFSDLPRLHEEFAGGIGMYLELAVTRGALLFRDRGYFWRFRHWRLRLPRWLSVGRFELLHRNIDSRRYQIIIRVAHPLLGTLFYQRGEFCRQDT